MSECLTCAGLGYDGAGCPRCGKYAKGFEPGVDDQAQNGIPGLSFAYAVLVGKINHGPFMRIAAQRFIGDLRAIGEGSEFYYCRQSVDEVLQFCLECRHVKGHLARQGRRFEPEDWQVFIISYVFGLRRRSSGRRRCEGFVLEAGRKNGVSFFCLVLMRYQLRNPQSVGYMAGRHGRAQHALRYAAKIHPGEFGRVQTGTHIDGLLPSVVLADNADLSGEGARVLDDLNEFVALADDSLVIHAGNSFWPAPPLTTLQYLKPEFPVFRFSRDPDSKRGCDLNAWNPRLGRPDGPHVQCLMTDYARFRRTAYKIRWLNAKSLWRRLTRFSKESFLSKEPLSSNRSASVSVSE